MKGLARKKKRERELSLHSKVLPFDTKVKTRTRAINENPVEGFYSTKAILDKILQWS